MKLKIAKIPIRPYSRFHFGELKMDDNLALSTTGLHAHSDTLFAGLVHAHSALYGSAEDLILHFQRGEIKISSLLYYFQRDEEVIYFLPKPVFLDIDGAKSQDGKHKLRNKVKFISHGVWESENGLDINQWAVPNSNYRIIDEVFVVTVEECEKIGMNENMQIVDVLVSPKSPQRAHADHLGPFYQADVLIGDNGQFDVGWYFAYAVTAGKDEAGHIISEDEIEGKLKTAVNVMAYTGIGGERYNTGRTITANPEFGEMQVEISQSANQFMNLSLLCPTKDDFEKVKYYTSTLRGGRRIPGGQAKVIRMISEGALCTGEVKGRMVDLGQDEYGRKIHRLGIPLIIPFEYEKG